VRGVYDASASELQRLFSEGENNTMIPVHNWMAFAEKQGMKGAIDLVDLAPFASALMSCYQAMEQVKGQIYELMGIADIQRGQTDPNETLGAQIIKSNNAAGRLKTMQHSVVDFATSLLSIKAQIICNHFTDETLVKISGAMQLSDEDKQLIPQAIELLRDEASKNFRIEVTSDSMIYQDEQQEKADRVAFLAAVGSFMQSALPAAQASPELTPMLCEMLKFGVTAFKAGKQLEGIIDQTADDLRKQYEMSKGQPKPPPVEIQKAQMDSQAKMQQLQMTAQLEQAKLQGQMELEKAKQEYQAQENQLKFQLEAQRNQADLEMQARVAQMKMMTERNTQVLLAHINNGAKIETARISAGTDDGAQAYMTEEDMAHAMEHPMQPIANAIGQGNQQMAQAISALVDTINAQHNRPKTVVRGQDGKIIGVQ
jgi:multimeric flavodoxin WrbA